MGTILPLLLPPPRLPAMTLSKRQWYRYLVHVVVREEEDVELW
jgi:hypothetical protein